MIPDPGRFLTSLADYFFKSSAACPYGLGRTAVYQQAYLGGLPDEVMDLLLAHGFRRNGNIIYTMACRGCKACVPIRLSPREFKPRRNQKRVWQKNEDITTRVGPLVVDQERLDLCNKFLSIRYPGKESSASDYYSGFFLNSIVQTVEIAYCLADRLIGVAIVDLTATAMNAVYFYFDPDFSQRSLGTYNIISLIDMGRLKGMEFIYLGYWIEEVRAMSYKARFLPHSIFRDQGWQKITADRPETRKAVNLREGEL